MGRVEVLAQVAMRCVEEDRDTRLTMSYGYSTAGRERWLDI